MNKVQYQDLAVLVADDFSNFRGTVNSMLLNLGVRDVAMASSGEEVIEKCESSIYDVILCDYDLGAGRNGQHVLEELRQRQRIAPTSVFIMVSAEASRNIVMSAYDCEPDDYLMKPITGVMLQKRMHRLLEQKQILRPVYTALRQGDMQQATDLLIDRSIADDRHSVAAQKMLGELFIRQAELPKAEKLYTRALEARQLDWARLGLARVKHLKGDLELAGDWLDKIVAENPLYLPAYDVLADNWDKRGERIAVQETIKRAVDVSPMSILRQKRLAKVANDNEDSLTAVEALRKTIKLGRLSCYGSPDDNFEFARTVSKALEKNLALPAGALPEAITVLQASQEVFDLSAAETAQLNLVQGRLHANGGSTHEAKKCLLWAQDLAADGELDIDIEIDRVDLLLSLGENQRANELLSRLQERHVDDQSALEKLDKFLTEPASESNRALVAEVNREGIDLYSVGDFDRALECFEKARKLFPKHVGIQLNIVQSLVGKLKEEAASEQLLEQCRSTLILVESLVDREHSQYERFLRLKRRAEVFIR